MPVLAMSELERATGMKRSTIHYYLREGLLPQPQKTGGTRSLYTEDHVVLLRQITEAKVAGRTLSQIRDELQTHLREASANTIDLEAQEYKRIHQAILKTATREFVRKGYRDTVLANVIRQLGMSSSVFYAHFPTKRQLWIECYCTLVEWSIAYLEPRLAESSNLIERMLTRSAVGLTLHRINVDLLALVSGESVRTEPGALRPVEEAEGRMNRDIAEELAAMRDPPSAPPSVPDEMLAYILNQAFHAALARAAWDTGFSLLDFTRANIWLWLAVRAAMAGRVNVDSELAQYEERIRRLVETPPPVLPGLEE